MSILNINLSNIQETLVSGTNIKTINGESLLGSGDLTIQGVSFGSSGQIPVTNALGDDFDYSSNLSWNSTNRTLSINTISSNSNPISITQESTSNSIKLFVANRSSIEWAGTSGTLYLSGRGNGFFIGGSSSDASARLHIKGSGSTSATTNLLLQNSSSTDLFKVTDDGVVTIPYRLGIGRTPSNSLDVDNATINVIRNDYINTANNAYTVARANRSNGNISFWQKVAINTSANPTEALFVNGNLRMQLEGQSGKDFQINPYGTNDHAITGGNVLHLQYLQVTASYDAFMAYSSSTRGLNVGTSSSMGAKLGVKGGGSGSGTTTFLLRNGSDADLFKVTDDSNIQWGLNDGSAHYINTPIGQVLAYSNAAMQYGTASTKNIWIGYTSNQTISLLSTLRVQLNGGNYGNNHYFQLKGKGNTSSTGSMYVKNTDGNDMLELLDNGVLKTKGAKVFADNAAAIAGGLDAGSHYHTATGEYRIVV